MKITFRILLVAAICFMAYLCVTSITTPIEFEKAKEYREKAIIKKLIDIRSVEIEYQKQKGLFCANADTLIDFIENGQVPMILKEGTLTDEQLKNGLTEEKAIKIIHSGNAKEIAANGLENFRRDTSYISVYESLFSDKYSRDEIPSIMEIPFSNKQRFRLDTAHITNPVTGITLPLFEASASYDTYLYDLNHQQLVNLKDKQTKLSRFCGLKVGSVTESNNHAGNWE